MTLCYNHIAAYVARPGRVGERRAALQEVADQLERVGFYPSDIFDALVQYVADNPYPGRTPDAGRIEKAKKALVGKSEFDAEVLAAVEEPDKPKSRFTVELADDFSLTDLPDFLVDGAILEGSVHAFYGATQAGKTFAAINMAMCVASGRAWHDRETRPAAVLWVAAEDAFGVKLRCMAWMKHHGARGLPFAVIKDGLFNLRQPETVSEIVNAAKELLNASGMGHILVVIDTLSRAAPGADEVSGKDTGEVIAAFDAIRNALPATVAVIHHSGKNEESGLRGHSSLGQGIDSYTKVKKTGAGHVMEFEKVKNAKLPAPIGFSLEVVAVGQYANGKIIDSCVTVPRDLRPVEVGPIDLNQVAETHRNVLATEVRDNGQELPDALTGGAGIKGVSVAEWRKSTKAALGDGVKSVTFRSAWSRTLKILLELGAVRTCSVDGVEYAFLIDTS